MNLTADILGTAAVGALVVLGAIGNYLVQLRSKPQQPTLPPGVAAIGMELGNKEQVRELIEAVKDVAKAIRDEKQEELAETIEELMEELRKRDR